MENNKIPEYTIDTKIKYKTIAIGALFSVIIILGIYNGQNKYNDIKQIPSPTIERPLSHTPTVMIYKTPSVK